MRNLKLLAFVALAVVMVVAACGGGGGAISIQPTAGISATSVATVGAQPTATTAVRVTQPTSMPPVTVVPTIEPLPTEAVEAGLNLDSISGGLTQLKSYRSKLYMRFVGKDAQGQAVDNSWTMEEEFILDPRAQHITWISSESKGGQPAETSGYESITIGLTSYWITTDASGTETCMVVSSSDATLPEQILSADMWGSITNAQYANTETVNGIPAKHYVWSEGTLASWGLTAGKGDTWVAVDGGFVVKQRIEATGKGVLLAGEDEEGTTTWEWDVTDPNGSFQIVPPAGCESAATDVPIMLDALDQSMYGDMVSYTSPSAFADVVTFYKTEMPKAGWQASGEPMDTETYSMLTYTKDTRTATVMISYDESNKTTSVVISVAKE